ncbi:MAG TPA: ATP-binding protein, partial [Longimicrobium sp.]|nr:ATP-binding protein [Longimicrobium sp.]
GIPPAERGRIWQPFYRLDRDARSAAGGSGIGLSVVRELVEGHGGKVEATEAPGGGARFTVELPEARPMGAARTEPAREVA